MRKKCAYNIHLDFPRCSINPKGKCQVSRTRNKNNEILHQREHEHMSKSETHKHNTSPFTYGSSATEV